MVLGKIQIKSTSVLYKLTSRGTTESPQRPQHCSHAVRNYKPVHLETALKWWNLGLDLDLGWCGFKARVH